ncbi:MAG: arginine--tRNA ligase, partial [Pirellulaceae bacterium]|nr:arginine--tRNA ligase [Pirellulaceae bacterium]
LALATEHASIHDRALAETARLHEGDEENVRLWNEFLPHCRDDMLRIYQRLGVTFDRELGESFYHDRLAGVIENLRAKGLAEDSEGAVCVFFGESETPMIVQKSDGAYLYSTTDLATIDYRMAEWNPDVILYVVDHRQHDHFAKLFKVARQLGHDVDLRHLAFGTVLGSDGTPYKTREGDAETLDSLLDEAVTRARSVVDQTQAGPTLSENEKQRVASVVGHAAVKYRDLSHNRESDYEFSYEKMLALTGDTAPYLQMGYSRVRSIFEKGGVDVDELRGSGAAIQLNEPAERQLGLQLRQFGEALERAVIDYRPNVLTEYVYALSTAYARFFESCHVLRAESEELKQSRLLLCDLTARTLRRGLELLGIEVLERM